jgi:tungstate transport system ATP-binding protein
VPRHERSAAAHGTRAGRIGGAAGGTLLLALQQAGVQFGAQAALRDITLQIHRGDRLALVGANGSGKTTLLRLLHGLLPPTSGQRLLPAGGRRQSRRCCSSGPSCCTFSVRRNLQLALWLAGVPAAERAARVDGALQRVGLQAWPRAGAQPVGRAAAAPGAGARLGLQPDILFLDEPTASLDPMPSARSSS